MRSRVVGLILGAVASLALVGTALATDCVNASKADQSAGVQVVLDGTTGEIEWMTPGVAERIERGVLDPEAEDSGFHGLIGIDFDGDGVVDVSTWLGVGPDGTEIPEVAQFKGPADKGLTNICLFLPELCVGS